MAVPSSENRETMNSLHIALGIAVLLFIAISTFSSVVITVDPHEPKAYAVERILWGIVKSYREIRWIDQDDEDDIEGWMAQTKDGDWHLYITEPDAPEGNDSPGPPSAP